MTEKDEYRTPEFFYEALHRIFHFTIDAAASRLNHRHPRYWTKKSNAFSHSWKGERVFLNPPYSDPEPWVRKAYDEVENNGCHIVVAIVRLDPGSRWFRWVEKAAFRWNPPYRMHFEHGFTKKPMSSYNFPVTVAVWVKWPTIPPWRRGGQK